MKSMFFKWLTVPKTNETRQQQSVQLWEVRWTSRHGEYHMDTRPELECFTSAEDAEAFAESLRNAFAIIRTTSGNRVTVRQAA